MVLGLGLGRLVGLRLAGLGLGRLGLLLLVVVRLRLVGLRLVGLGLGLGRELRGPRALRRRAGWAGGAVRGALHDTQPLCVLGIRDNHQQSLGPCTSYGFPLKKATAFTGEIYLEVVGVGCRRGC